MNNQTEKMRAFIIKFVYSCLIIGLIYVVLKYAMPFLMPFVLGFVFAFALQPLIRIICKKTGQKRSLVASLIMIVFYALLFTLAIMCSAQLVVLGKEGVSAIPNLYNNSISPALEDAQKWIETLVASLNPEMLTLINSVGDSISTSLSTLVSSISSSLLGGLTGVATSLPATLIKLIMTVVASFFFTIDYDNIMSFFTSQFSQSTQKLFVAIKKNGIGTLLKFAKAYAILITITFLELTIGFLLFRIEGAVVLAFFIAIVDILPILGTGTILIPWGIVLLITGNFPLGCGILILYAIITVVRQCLEPRVVGKQIGLHPLVTLICMFSGGYLFGIIGLFGLPIAATILMQLDRTGDIHLIRRERPEEVKK